MRFDIRVIWYEIRMYVCVETTWSKSIRYIRVLEIISQPPFLHGEYATLCPGAEIGCGFCIVV